MGGDYVGLCAALDGAYVNGEARGAGGEGGDGLDEVGHFKDGGVAAVEVDAGVGGDAFDGDLVVADAFAGGLVGEALRGFEDEDGGAGLGDLFRDGAGDRAADLFVGVEEEGDGAVEVAGFGESGDGFEGHEHAGFHIEDAGAVEFALGGAEGHLGEAAEGPDGVEVAQKQDASAFGARWAEAEFEDVAEVLLFVALDGGVKFGGPGGDEVGGAIDRGFVAGGGFDFDQPAEAGKEAGFGGGNGGLERGEVHGVRLSRSWGLGWDESALTQRALWFTRWARCCECAGGGTVVKKPQSA